MTTEEGHVSAVVGWKAWLAALALGVATLVVYLPVFQCSFVAYDDPTYVTANSMVQSGLGVDGVAWAFTSTVGGYWQPVTVLSHMADCSLFGMDPAAHHAMNLALHLANVLLLFGLLRALTGSVWRSGLVAALFALHPLNVESVAWVAERKNLLCTFFCFLSAWGYIRYVLKPSPLRYGLVFALMLLALMSKPMAVAWPLILLILDFWPLKRMTGLASFGKLLLEKVPLFALSVFFGLLTYRTQSAVGAVTTGEVYSLIDRLSYAVVNYVLYIDKAIWPAGLAVLYPMWTTPVSLRALLICLILLVFVTVVVLRRVARFPYLTVGWLWYLVALLPMAGIVLVGHHSMADRFAYIPLIGIFVMISWGTADFIEETRRFRPLAVGLSLLVLLALGWTSRVQVGYWRDSTSLFRHAIEVTAGNYVMHENLGREYVAAGNADEAIAQFAQSIRLNNSYLPARANLAMLLFAQGKQVEALALQSESISLYPHDAQLQCDAGIMLVDAGRKGEGAACLMQALWLDPNLAKAHFRLALLLLEAGRPAEAYPHLVATVQLKPESEQARALLEQLTAAMKKAKPQ